MEQWWTRPRPAERAGTRRWALLLGAVAVALVTWAVTTGEYQAYDLGYSAGSTRAVVESWSVKLPFGYRLAWWQSTPPGPQDGPRLLETFAQH